MPSDAEFIRTWAGTTKCYCDEIGDPDVKCAVCQITDKLREVREEGRREENKRCMNAVCDGCAHDDEYAEGYHHYGLGNKRVCHAAALREGRDS